ncbi:MAG: Lrp/AsnC family transcriptional regulator [Gammaproteobacteria bacterium]
MSDQKKDIAPEPGTEATRPLNRLDAIDLAILRVLQDRANSSIADISAAVGLSHTPCWKRVRRLHEARVITDQVSLLDPLAVGFGVTAFAHIRVDLAQPEALERFVAAVAGVPQVMECYAVSGSWNFLLKIVSDSVESYERLLKKKLIHLPGVSSLESTIALARVKHTTRLPLGG